MTKIHDKKRKHKNDNTNNTSNTNPLAQARRNKNNEVKGITDAATSTTTSSKKDKIDQIWFRKCHIGYQCFVEYYMKQSIGVIIPSSSHQHHHHHHTSITATDNEDSQRNTVQSNVIVGMSRASQKRRLKKKGKNNNQQQEQQDESQNSPQHQTQIASLSATTNNDNNNNNNNNKQQQNNHKHPLIVSFHSYCKKNEQIKNLDSYQLFFDIMSKPLPLTFRIRQSSLYLLNNNDNNDSSLQQFRQDLLSILSSSSKTIISKNNDNHNDQSAVTESIVRSMKIRLYNNNNNNNNNSLNDTANNNNTNNYVVDHDDDIIYQSSTSKYNVAKELKDLLLQYQNNGIIARQELGSMLPVAVLQQFIDKRCQLSKKTSTNSNNQMILCLDMCASPGSKTLQLYETLLTHNDNKNENSFILIANDISENRLNALKDSIQRSGVIVEHIENDDNNNRKTRLIYACQDATKFELIKNNNKHEILKYDIILCDVPCSGDGTYRKDNSILLSWKPNISNILYHTQIKILIRAIQLCKINGYISYSTCSYNPIENEAVISTILQQYNDNNISNDFEIEIVDCPTIPGLVLHPGITNWKVAQYNNNNDHNNDRIIDDDDDDDNHHHLLWYDTYEDAISSSQMPLSSTTTIDTITVSPSINTNNKRRKQHHHSKEQTTTPVVGRWVRTMWPMKSSSSSSTNINEQLIKCRRLLPHNHDSGGFFIAILHKKMKEKKRK